jgi:Ca-activated chloride channel family protein
MIALLALMSCVTGTVGAEATVVPVDGPDPVWADAFAAPVEAAPNTAMKLNMRCFGSERDEEMSSVNVNQRRRSYQTAAPSVASGGAVAAAPVATGATRADDALADAKPKKMAESPKMDAYQGADMEMAAGGALLPMAVPIRKGPLPTLGEPLPPSESLKPALDWGATVYLSNDDSMSLASAQRVIYNVENHRTPDPSEVRPHELLNFFSFDTAQTRQGELFSVQPSATRTGPTQLTAAFAVHGGMPERKPLDLTLVVDRSGSMAGEGRMEYIKRGLHKLQAQLKPGDRVDVVLFDDQVCTPLQDYVVGRDATSSLSRVIDALAPRGSTDIGIGMREAYRIATAPSRVGGKRNQRVMLITDAVVNTGDVDPATLASIASAYEQHDIRLTGIGVGRDFRDDVLDRMTEKGKGAYVYIGSGAVADRVFGSQFASLTQTIAHDVKFSVTLPKSLAMKRFYGEEASTDASDIQPIHYYAGTTQLFLQDLEVDPQRLQPTDPVTFQIRYEDPSTHATREQVVTTTVGDMLKADHHNIDKGRALMAWTDVIQAKAMGNNPCGPTFDQYASRAAAVTNDAEMVYVGRLSEHLCPGYRPSPIAEAPAASAFKVKIDADVPIDAVSLACGGVQLRSTLSGSDTVARFPTAPAGRCGIVLEGVVPMSAEVTVPATGGDVRCVVRGGTLRCS